MRRPTLLALALLLVAACDSGAPGPVATGLLGQLADRTDFELFAEVADETGVDDVLASGGPYTVFAPTQLAFEYLGRDFLAVLRQSANRPVLTRILRHHVVAGRLAPEDFADGDTLRSLDGRPLPVRRLGPVVQVGGVTIRLDEPFEGDNGVAYPAVDVMLGAVTTVERIRLSPSLATFERLADRASALPPGEAPGGVTVLAPLDDAFLALGGRQLLLEQPQNAPILSRVLRAHVVPGLPDLTDGAGLTTLDGDVLAVRVENGVRTVGGRQILREEMTADGRLVLLGGVVLSPLSLGQRFQIEPTLQQLWMDLRDRDPATWARLLDDSEALTVFAPTDFAYSQRGRDVNRALREPENRTLAQKVLRVHIVEGRYRFADLTDGLDLPTLNGYPRRIEFVGGAPYYDGRLIVQIEANQASNGRFFTLGTVLLPLADAFDTGILRGFTAHARAVRRAGLESLFRTPGLTAFVVPDTNYAVTPQVLERPDLGTILRFNATMTAYPDLTASSFTSLSGAIRTIVVTPCPPDPTCTPYSIATPQADTVLVDRYGPSTDGTGYFHALRSFSFPPGS